MVIAFAQVKSQDVWREIECIVVGYFDCNSYVHGLTSPMHVEMTYRYVFGQESWIIGPMGK